MFSLSLRRTKQGNMVSAQLNNFHQALRRYGETSSEPPLSWPEAFERLRGLLSADTSDRKQILFIDEFPWLDIRRSGFLTAFEAFWNGWASGQGRIMLIMCGSATSWIIKNVLHNRGGLYNRVTHELHLRPFTLGECEQYLKSLGIKFSRYDITCGYMAFGGIPHYWKQLTPGLSLAQNIDRLFFANAGRLRREYDMLYRSLFSSPKKHLAVVELLQKHPQGLSREEISAKVKMESGGSLSTVLSDLEHSDFIVKYKPINSRVACYKLIDFFTIFYLRFVGGGDSNDSQFWSHTINTPRANVWYGIAFELVCQTHVEQIKRTLQIGGVLTNRMSWRGDGAQIDLIFSRADNVVNLCEVKFSRTEFEITKAGEDALRAKIVALSPHLPSRAAIQLTMITTYGIKANIHSGIVQSQVTMSDLFDA